MTELNLHTLKNTPGARHRKRCEGRGRGSGHGKTSGRGHKGQYARSGHKHKPGFEGGQMRLIRRIPKRGFNQSEKKRFIIVNLNALSRFEKGATVTPDMLGFAAPGAKKAYAGVKILGDGELANGLTVKAHAFSASARQKIEKAGGRCETVAD